MSQKRSLHGNWVEEMAPKLDTIIAHSGAEGAFVHRWAVVVTLGTARRFLAPRVLA